MGQIFLLIPPTGSEPADEWVRMANESLMGGDHVNARRRFLCATRLDPRHAIATQNLAVSFAHQGMYADAMITIDRAEIFDPKHAGIKMNKALILSEAGQARRALAWARKAVELESNIMTNTVAGLLSTACGYPDEAEAAYDKVLAMNPTADTASMNAPFVQTLAERTPEQFLKARKRYWEAHRWTGDTKPHKNDRDPERPLRVGYVGGDFKLHSAAFIVRRVLWNHSAAVVPILYSTLPLEPDKDELTQQFMAKAGDNWRDISKLKDDEADALIRQDRIDILVDLAAHTAGGRLPLFTRKPAPVQVSAWGFATGTGCPEIDYFLADPVAVPASDRQHFAEHVYDLPCMVTFDPPPYTLDAWSVAPWRQNGFLTFGCHSRYEKLSDQFLCAVGEILRRVPDSHMEFKDGAFRRPDAIRRVMALMPDISEQRLQFSIATSHDLHMLAMQRADLCLDPWPHTGGLVTLEQLYMGCPLVTRYGSNITGRITASVLTAIGRTEWITRDAREYVEKAVAMVADPKGLAELRKSLRAELMGSPVVAGYVDAVEKAYRAFWFKWLAR